MSAYETVTAKIIKQLEEGQIPWERPWVGVTGAACSGMSNKPYSLLNQLLLDKPGYYYTYNKAVELGGRPQKGTGKTIVGRGTLRKRKDETDEEFAKRTKGRPTSFPTTFVVFNEYDCGLNIHDRLPDTQFELDGGADAVISDYLNRSGVIMESAKQNQAFYSPVFDTVVVPVQEQFKEQAEYYSTVFHELTHSTGHKSRLDRFEDDEKFGDEVYSKEELVAELGSAMMLNMLGIETESSSRNNAAYIQNWIAQLKNDTHLIWNAAKAAEKAVELILGKENV